MLINELDKLMPDKQVVNLIENAVKRTNVFGEIYWDCKKRHYARVVIIAITGGGSVALLG
jgi:hypothetical protein